MIKNSFASCNNWSEGPSFVINMRIISSFLFVSMDGESSFKREGLVRGGVCIKNVGIKHRHPLRDPEPSYAPFSSQFTKTISICFLDYRLRQYLRKILPFCSSHNFHLLTHCVFDTLALHFCKQGHDWYQNFHHTHHTKLVMLLEFFHICTPMSL